MERRLKLAKELLNPNDSVLIVTIDEKEYLRRRLVRATSRLPGPSPSCSKAYDRLIAQPTRFDP